MQLARICRKTFQFRIVLLGNRQLVKKHGLVNSRQDKNWKIADKKLIINKKQKGVEKIFSVILQVGTHK